MAADSTRPVTVSPVCTEAELLQALAIREVVFIEEQRVPEGIERDADDTDAYHVLAFEGGHAVGTGRLVMLSEPPAGEGGRWARLGRMAVLKAHRRGGIGTQLLAALEAEGRRRGASGLLLHAQVAAKDFYVRHGYLPVGPEFEEAGMPHLEMKKRL